ncbi:hypothetical protein [Kineococcus xinjiangensis]|nr:hypothetical protein [Kineococcus xinjiangensis]
MRAPGHVRTLGAAVGTTALTAYAAVKASWALGVDVGVRNAAQWHRMLDSLSDGERLAALWRTVGLDLLGVALLLVLASSRAGRASAPARLLRASGWLAGAALLLPGAAGLAVTLGPTTGLWPAAPGDPGPLADWVFVVVYGSFAAAGAGYLLVSASWRSRASHGPVPEHARS